MQAAATPVYHTPSSVRFDWMYRTPETGLKPLPPKPATVVAQSPASTVPVVSSKESSK